MERIIRSSRGAIVKRDIAQRPRRPNSAAKVCDLCKSFTASIQLPLISLYYQSLNLFCGATFNISIAAATKMADYPY